MFEGWKITKSDITERTFLFNYENKCSVSVFWNEYRVIGGEDYLQKIYAPHVISITESDIERSNKAL